jgi:hypothetical protein
LYETPSIHVFAANQFESKHRDTQSALAVSGNRKENISVVPHQMVTRTSAALPVLAIPSFVEQGIQEKLLPAIANDAI